MKTHYLKTAPGPFLDVWTGRKRFEVRRNDRGFVLGDILRLGEWTPPGTHAEEVLGDGGYTGRLIVAVVTYLLPGGEWGLPADLCVMGIEVLSRDARP